MDDDELRDKICKELMEILPKIRIIRKNENEKDPRFSHIRGIYNRALSIIDNSELPPVKDVRPYVAREFLFETVNGYFYASLQRLKKEDPLEVTIGHPYFDYLENGGPYTEIEAVFTALHEIYENALLFQGGGEGYYCPRANALAGLTLTGHLDDEIRDYVHKEWGIVSYNPDKRTPEGRLEIEFCENELAKEFNLTNKNAYIYLRTFTLIGLKLWWGVDTDPEKYVKEIKI